jgi:hypothetical protein
MRKFNLFKIISLVILANSEFAIAQNEPKSIYDTYSEIIESKQYSNPDSVIYISKLIIDLAEVKKDSLSIARAWLSIARSYYVQGNYNESKKYYLISEKYFRIHSLKKFYAESLN